MDFLTLDQVSIARGGKSVLDTFSYAFEAGAHYSVAGPSGAGKSTLLALICGVLKPNSGSIVFRGADITQQSAAMRDQCRAKEMGVVFQNLGLASALTVEGNLGLAQQMAGQNVDHRASHDLLERFGLLELRRAKPRQLSRGQAQRAAIARALITNPTLLIADEPTASLDAQWRDCVMDIMLERAAAHTMTLIVSTHDSDLASRFAHQIRLPTDSAS